MNAPMKTAKQFKFEVWQDGKMFGVATSRCLEESHGKATHMALGLCFAKRERMSRRERWMRQIWLWFGATNKAASGVVIRRVS